MLALLLTCSLSNLLLGRVKSPFVVPWGQGAAQDWCQALFPGRPSCPFGSTHHPQLLSSMYTHQQLQEPPRLAQLTPLAPILREVEFNLSFQVRPRTPPQGRQTHRSLNRDISRVLFFFLV